jgi:gliding motility-associated-like protein
MKLLYSCFLFLSWGLSLSAQLSLQKAFLSPDGETGQIGCVGVLGSHEVIVAEQVFDASGKSGLAISLHDAFLKPIWRKKYFEEEGIFPVQLEIIKDTVYICGVILEASKRQVFLLKTDHSGTLLSYKIIESADGLYPYSLEAHPDGGLVFFGYNTTRTETAEETSGRSVIRFSGEGEVIWSKKLDWRVNWGYAKVLHNGGILCGGSANILCLDKNGKQLWAKNFPDYRYFLPAVESNGKIFLCSYDYSAEYAKMLILHPDGSVSGTSESFKIKDPKATGLWQKKYPMVVGTAFRKDGADINITVLDTDGTVRRQLLADNYFGYASPDKLHDACSYAADTDPSGGLVVLGLAFRQGYTLLKAGAEAPPPCWSVQKDALPRTVSGAAAINIRETSFSLSLPDRMATVASAAPYRDSLICYDCPPLPDIFPSDTILCGGDTLYLDLSLFHAEGVLWENGSRSPIRKIHAPGRYSITVYGACDTVQDTLSVYVMPLPEISFSWSPEDPLPGESTLFQGSFHPETKQEWWQSGTPAGTGPAAVIIFPYNGEYPVSYRITDSLGCIYEANKQVKVALVDFYLPEAFSPDGNGLNDKWQPEGSGIGSYRLEVFDRWGEKVFSGTDLPWNGYYKEKALPQDLYFFRVRILDLRGELHHINGRILLIR